MALSDLSSSQLQRLIQLIKEKESLQAQLDKVNDSLATLESGSATSKGPDVGKRPVRRRRRHGTLKQGILEILSSVGKKGLTVKELAEQLKAKPTSVSVWFYTTGKKIKGIKKVGKARFAYL